MARLGGAMASLDAAREAVSAALATFVNPTDDPRGRERKEAIQTALDAAGAATRGLEDAAEAIKDADLKALEPWDEEDEDEEDEEDEDE